MVPGSGCGSFFRGDLGTPFGWFVEAKTRVGAELRFQPNWWYKALNDADRLGRPHVALIYKFTDSRVGTVFQGYPSELVMAPPDSAMRKHIEPPDTTYRIITKESRIPFETFRDVLRPTPGRRAGSIGLEFTARLRGLPQTCTLWVIDSHLFPRMIKDTHAPGYPRGL